MKLPVGRRTVAILPVGRRAGVWALSGSLRPPKVTVASSKVTRCLFVAGGSPHDQEACCRRVAAQRESMLPVGRRAAAILPVGRRAEPQALSGSLRPLESPSGAVETRGHYITNIAPYPRNQSQI